MNKILMTAILLAAAGAGYCAEDSVKTFPAAGLKEISLDTGAGAISVKGAPGDIQVEVTDNEPEKCALTMKTDGARLILKAEDISVKQGFWKMLFSKGPRSVSGCRAGFNVTAPPALNIKADNGSGRINISAMSGDVAADNGSGPISFEGLTGNLSADNGSGGISGTCCAKNLHADTGSGGINIKGLCGPVDADAGSGAIRLQWDKVPSSGQVRAETGSGNIILTFPDSAKLSSKLETSSGRVSNDFDNSGKFPVSAEAGSGNISLRKAGK